MRTRCLTILVIAACGGTAATPKQAPAPTRPASEGEALAAYEGKRWAQCAELYIALAEQEQDKRKNTSLYNAACCYALDGKSDLAFATLERLPLRDIAHLEADTDLASLRADPRWPTMIATVKERVATWEASLGAPELRRELLAMVAEDQQARMAWIAKQDDKALADAVEVVDRKMTARMKEVVAKHGWPGTSLVGEDGTQSAWLLVQHADKDVAFQKQCLALIEPMVATGEARAEHHAYLYDRVAVAEKRPQRFGTQFGPDGQPRPIEDEANLEARRKAIGLPTMAAYRQQMRAMYGEPKK